MLYPQAMLAWRRVRAGVLTMPASGQAWAEVGACLAGTAALALPFGLFTGFLQWRPVHDVRVIGQVGAAALLMPALGEELLFRAALLPHPRVDGALPPGTALRRSVLPLAVFVAYHLINPKAKTVLVFTDARFLTLAGILGAACSVAYYVTGGSLIAAALVHWLPVCVWLLGFDGLRKTQHPLAQ